MVVTVFLEVQGAELLDVELVDQQILEEHLLR
jgi:hypothetical protein